MYSCKNLEDILEYINESELKDLKILEYHLQGYETYIGVKNGYFLISNKPIEIIKSYLEKFNKLTNIQNEIADIDLFHRYKNMDTNTVSLREDLLDKEEEEELEKYGNLFEYYGFTCDNVIDNNYKFSVINYFN
jgi:hypothetical protein